MDDRHAELAELAGAITPQLRVLQRAKQKSAVKLERIFWSQLEDLARDDKTTLSKLVFDVVGRAANSQNKTSLLRCYALDRLRRGGANVRLKGQAFDLMALIASCPVPAALITSERKLTAFNPAFSDLIKSMRDQHARDRAIQLSFSEPLPKILLALREQPNNIRTYQIGLQLGDGKPGYFGARFALADRSKGVDSLIVIYINPR